LGVALTFAIALDQDAFGWNRHREERSDVAIQGRRAPDDSWIASLTLAMTILVRPNRIVP
jgi:hypothetical protein